MKFCVGHYSVFPCWVQKLRLLQSSNLRQKLSTISCPYTGYWFALTSPCTVIFIARHVLHIYRYIVLCIIYSIYIYIFLYIHMPVWPQQYRKQWSLQLCHPQEVNIRHISQALCCNHLCWICCVIQSLMIAALYLTSSKNLYNQRELTFLKFAYCFCSWQWNMAVAIDYICQNAWDKS